MSVSTIAMSLLPGFGSLGMGATVCFVVLRLVQSACFGGEIGVATTYVAEMSPRKAGAACGILFGLLGFGVVLAGGVNAVIHAAFAQEFADFDGWRVAFFFGGVLGVVGYFVRGALEETPAFAAMKETTQHAPLLQLLRDHRLALGVGIGLSAATGVVNGVLFAYLPAFLPTFGRISSSYSALILFAATVFNAAGVILIGYISDKTSWIKLHRLGCFGTLLAIVPVLGGLASGVVNPLVWVLLFAAGAATINGCIGQLLADIFPTAARASGITISYNLSAAIFQGLTPLAATVAIRATGSPLSPAILVAVGLLLAMASGLWCKKIGGHLLA
ncbi:MFS transporter [Burkholderia multivorans]|nr:MFS transporter [Burkholderia multivorans]